MVTVYLKEQPPVVVKGGGAVVNGDFWFYVRKTAADHDTLAEFRSTSIIGYMIERGNDSQAD